MNAFKAKSLVLINKSPSFKKVAILLTVFFFAFICFISFTPWQQTTFGYGKVLAYDPSERQQVISAPLDGRLSQWFVQEGTHVKKGQPIVKIYDNDPQLLENLLLEKNAILQSEKANKQAINIAYINTQRQEELYNKGVSARKSYEQAMLVYNQYLVEAANIKAELARINVRIARQKTQLVTAPSDGVILRRFAGHDSVQVKTGDIIAELVPDTSSRAVELWIPGNDVPLVRLGDTARIQFEGWPAIQFSGWPSVAVGTFGGKVVNIDAADNGRGEFRLLIIPTVSEPWPAPAYLRQGVKVQAWVLLRRVPLWYELWRQFNGFPKTRSEVNETKSTY